MSEPDHEQIERERERRRAMEREEIRSYVERHRDDPPLVLPVAKIGIHVPRVPTPEEQAEMDRRREEDLAKLVEYEQREIERKARELWMASGVPERARDFAEANPEGPPPPSAAAYRIVQEAIEAGETALLMGPWGTGKTCVAACAVRVWTSGCQRAIYLRAVDLGHALEDIRHDRSDDGMRETVDRYAGVPLLVVDEEHERVRSEDSDRVLRRILDGRYGSKRPTVVITNESRAAVADSLGPAIVSRIQEAGRVVVCDWPSLRRGRP